MCRGFEQATSTSVECLFAITIRDYCTTLVDFHDNGARCF